MNMRGPDMEEARTTHLRPSRSTTFATNLATLLLVLACVFGIYLIGKAILGGRQEVAAHQDISAKALQPLPPEVVQPETVPVTIRIGNANGHQLLLSTARDLIVIVWMILLLWLVRRLLLSVREGDPFTAANVRRLRSMGFLLLVGLPLANGLSQILDARLAETSAAGRLGTIFTAELGPGPIVALGVFVLAEVFAHGARLREDVEGTV